MSRIKIGLTAVAAIAVISSQAAASTHKVQSKDTLYSIAKHYGTTVSAIQKANKMDESVLLKIGTTIQIPDGKTNAVSPKSAAKASLYKKSTGVFGVCRKDGADVWQDNELVASLDKDESFEIIGKDAEKYRVRLKDGRTGWILDNWVTIKETSRSTPQISRSINKDSSNCDIVNIALAYRGSKYSSGGMSSRSGFDCSGFIKFLYETKGISLPHSSSAQFNYGKPVDKSDLKSGDIVFFSDTYKSGISHVGLYIGDNKFIHAATSKSGVKVDDLNSSYYAKRYTGARRIE